MHDLCYVSFGKCCSRSFRVTSSNPEVGEWPRYECTTGLDVTHQHPLGSLRNWWMGKPP